MYKFFYSIEVPTCQAGGHTPEREIPPHYGGH